MMGTGTEVIPRFSGLCLVSTCYDTSLDIISLKMPGLTFMSLSYKILCAKKEKNGSIMFGLVATI